MPSSELSSPAGACSAGKCCTDTPATVYFNPVVPFGLSSTKGAPIGDFWTPTHSNNGYNCAPSNPYFLGWTNMFNAFHALLGAAKGVVTVYELEMQQELDTMDYTAPLRFIYDNSSPQSAGLQIGQIVDVVSNLRSLMSANAFDPGRVDWSSAWSDASVATFNCTDVYTDWARAFDTDSLSQAVNAGVVGVNPDFTATDSLVCANDTKTTGMQISPIYHTQPDIVDVHIYPQVNGATNSDAQIQQVAALDYGDLPHFLGLAGLQSAAITIGETYAGKIYQGSNCWSGTPTGAPSDNVAGFNQSALASYTVFFRPWIELEDPSGVCFPYGQGPSSSSDYQNVNYNGTGPYTPTNH